MSIEDEIIGLIGGAIVLRSLITRLGITLRARVMFNLLGFTTVVLAPGWSAGLPPDPGI